MKKLKIKYQQDYRAPSYFITDIHLDFDLEAENTTVTATSTIIRQAHISTPLLLDGEDLHLLSLQVNHKKWSCYHLKGSILIINQLPEKCILTIKTLIHPDRNTALEGLYLSDKTLCTQCEAEGFRHITFYPDRPDILARFTTRILADKQRYPFLLSNGNCIDYGNNSDGRHWIIWHDPFPKPCYLFALVAGDFDVLYDSFTTCFGRKVSLKLFVNHGDLNRADWAMSCLKRAMHWDEVRFGLAYDLDTYMIVAVDFFNMGAMENKGLNIFNSKYILAQEQTATDFDYLNIERVIGHEYFHNWTGNRITCREWFQLSLKEGLTVFRDQEFSADVGSRTVNRINNVRVIRSAQFSEDASPMAHPVCPDKMVEVNNLYTLTVYEKGAEIIRMLHILLGEEKFQAGMRNYISRHDGSAVTCEDFVVAMEDASGLDLTLFRRWYSQSGTPLVTVRDDYNAKLKKYTLHVTQTTLPTLDQPEKQVLHIPLDIGLYDNQGKVIPLQRNSIPINSILNVTEKFQTFIFDQVPSQPIPALFCGFSAPVKLDYPYNDEQLITLMKFSHDDFSRWDAAQNLIFIYIRLNVDRYQKGKAPILPLHVTDAFRNMLDILTDPSLVAQFLTLPNESELAGLFHIVDPIAIHNVHNALTVCLADRLHDALLSIYHSSSKISNYKINHRDMNLRTLRNRCLHYLAFYKRNCDQMTHLITKQYYQADNMTNTLAAMSAAVAAQLPCQTTFLSEFEQRWQHDSLIMDKWFYLQAISPAKDVLKKVKTLMQHRAFSLSNPNRVQALLGTFVHNNQAAFHATDGSGYIFLVETLMELDALNPQVSSRLVDPLIYLKRYDLPRQQKMRAALEQLGNSKNLSKSLIEKINKALIET